MSLQLDITPELSVVERASIYAAGLFEGEGFSSITRARRVGFPSVYRLECGITMGDREPLDLLHGVWDGRVRDRPDSRPTHRAMFTWRLEAGRATAFLADIEPHILSERVKRKIALALEFQSQKAGQGGLGLDKNGPKTIMYRDRQRSYFERMRELNRRGVAA